MLMPTTPENGTERPLTSSSRTMLAISGLATIAMCYLFSLAAIVLLSVLLGGEIVVLVAAARVGLASKILPVVRRHAALLSIFLRSFWLKKGKDYRLLILEKEAPRLFAAVALLAHRFEIPPPTEISIDMNANAWVRLPGFRQGRGGTILAIGYDLLAGLNEGEVQAVLAHEMGHAKFVRRGIKRSLDVGVARIGKITSELSSHAEAYRSLQKTFHVAEVLLRPSDSLARAAARLLAKYSRQDEFEADRISAELFGSACLKTALIKLDLLGEKIARLPWTERVAQLESTGSFSQWLCQELSVTATDADVVENAARDVYSTHPSLADRIAALPPDSGLRPSMKPGIELLAEPDRVAVKLIAEIHRITAEHEEKDSRALSRWTKRNRNSHRQLQGFAVGFLAIGTVMLLVASSFSATLPWSVLCVAIGIFLWMRGRYRDTVILPVPKFAEIKKAWQAPRPSDSAEQEKRVEAQVTALLEKYPGKKEKLLALAEAGKSGLTHCNYLRAHVAGRLAINLDKYRVDGALIYMIASAGLGLWNQIDQNLEFVRQRTGLSTPSTTWGAAWTLFLMGDWGRAESLLWRASENDPNNATFLIMLAYAQYQRGKLQAAVLNATKAANLEPNEPEHVKVLVRALIDAGRLTDAQIKLRPLNPETTSDPEILMLSVRFHLMRHEYETAYDAARRMRECNSNPQWLIWLGAAFESARQDERAAAFYREALDLGHYPEALLGLAQLAVAGEDMEEAKRCLISALDLEKGVGAHGRNAVDLFHPIISQLTLLEEPRENCTAWIATFPAGSSPRALAQRAVMIYATNRREAENHLDSVTAAMQPTQGATAASQLQWREAPRDQQPARPVREGVQFVL